MSKWTSIKLGELVSITRGTTYKSLLLNQPGPVLLGLASIQRNGGFRSDKLKTYGGDSPEKLLVRPGELFASLKDVTQSGDLLGSVARVPQSGPTGRLSQDTVRLDLISDRVDPDFLYLSLLTPTYRAWCRQHATGTTNLGLPRDDFLAYEVFHPISHKDQRRVAGVLNGIDGLIENNRRRVEVLEEMARAIYREWFVKFRYPGHEDVPLVDSALGPIPSGWMLNPLSSVAKVNASQRKPDAKEVIRYLDISALTERSINELEAIAGADAPGRARRVLAQGDTVWATVRPNRRAHALVVEPGDDWIASTGLAVLTPKSVSPAFLFETTSTHAFSDWLVGRATGSAYPAVRAKDFEEAVVVVPEASIDTAFANIVSPMHKLGWKLRSESARLSALRDLLLPKLVTGQIDVSTLDLDVLVGDRVA